MAKRKRSSMPSGLVGRAVTAGRKALRQAESRVPADLRKQVERRVRDANKTVQSAIKEAQAQVRRASSRADVNSLLKRLDGLTKQARQLAMGTPPKRSTTRRAASTPKPAGKAAARRRPAATTRASASRSSSTRTAAPRRRAARPKPVVTEAPHPGETPSTMGEPDGLGR